MPDDTVKLLQHRQNARTGRPGLAAALSALFCAGILIQVVLIQVRGEPFCLNTGCRVVEELVELNPMLFNLMGAAFFAACATAAFLARTRPVFFSLFRLLCLCGVAAEGVLLSYQAFVAGAWCSYCLMVFSAIVILNLLCGARQVLAGAAVLGVEIALFSLLNFNISTGNIQELTLDNGTCAITRCAEPANTLYLIFSQDCPHCHRVIEALAGCSRCEFRFNPIKKISADLLPGTLPRQGCVPEINRLALNVLGIDAIPVLVVKRQNGYLFIKGDVEIINYIRNHCFSNSANYKVPEAERDFIQNSAPLFLQPDDSGGACSLDEQCAE